jgi:hypothetical protein
MPPNPRPPARVELFWPSVLLVSEGWLDEVFVE